MNSFKLGCFEKTMKFCTVDMFNMTLLFSVSKFCFIILVPNVKLSFSVSEYFKKHSSVVGQRRNSWRGRCRRTRTLAKGKTWESSRSQTQGKRIDPRWDLGSVMLSTFFNGDDGKKLDHYGDSNYVFIIPKTLQYFCRK